MDAAEVREMESRLAGQDMGFDATTDDDERDVQAAPVYYLDDKSSDLANNVETENWKNHANTRLAKALSSLDMRSQYIIRSRWLEDKKTTLQELAEHYQISAERVRQLEKNAMRKLKESVGDFF